VQVISNDIYNDLQAFHL